MSTSLTGSFAIACCYLLLLFLGMILQTVQAIISSKVYNLRVSVRLLLSRKNVLCTGVHRSRHASLSRPGNHRPANEEGRNEFGRFDEIRQIRGLRNLVADCSRAVQVISIVVMCKTD